MKKPKGLFLLQPKSRRGRDKPSHSSSCTITKQIHSGLGSSVQLFEVDIAPVPLGKLHKFSRNSVHSECHGLSLDAFVCKSATRIFEQYIWECWWTGVGCRWPVETHVSWRLAFGRPIYSIGPQARSGSFGIYTGARPVAAQLRWLRVELHPYQAMTGISIHSEV